MKTPGSNFYLTGYQGRDHVLFYGVLIMVCANLVISEVSEDLQAKVVDDKKNAGSIDEVPESKIDGGHQSTDTVHQRSRKITNESYSPALRTFLKNILKARDELKWIDRAASRINYRNGPYGTFYEREAMDDPGPSNDDSLNSNKNLQYKSDNWENRWTRDYDVPRTNNEDSEGFEYLPNKRELTDTDVSLEKLKETLLELRENLTRRNDDLKKDKPDIEIDENRKFNEENLTSKNNGGRDEHKKDTSLSRSKNQKHTEQLSASSNEDENTNLVWLNEPKSLEEIITFEKTLDDAEDQEKSTIRKKRTDIKNKLKNEENTGQKIEKFKENLVEEKTPDVNDYWRANNYKEVSNVDDLMALQGKLLDYDNDQNFGKEIDKFKNPERRLLSIVENESERPLSCNESKCLLQYNLFNKRKLLQSDDEKFEEDSLASDETINQINKSDNEKSNDNDDDSNDDSENIIQEIDEEEEPERNLIDDTKASETKRHVKSTLNQANDPYEARVNMLIKQRIAAKHRDDKNLVRRKRYPLGIIEYYDYDEEFENNIEDNRAKKDSSNINMEFDKDSENSKNCTLLNKKNEHAEEEEKEEKKKSKMMNKEPKEQFIVDLGQDPPKNETDKSGNPSKSPKGKVTFKENDEGAKIDSGQLFLKEGEKSLKHMDTEWSDRNEAKNENGRSMEERNLENTNPEIILPKESLEYIFRAPGKIEQQIVDVIFDDVQPIDLPEYNKQSDTLKSSGLDNRLGNPQKLNSKDNIDDDIDTVYDEMKKIYDWEDNESKNRLRLKGDQRLYEESKNNPEKDTNGTSGTNYMALKKTDDLFKGGIEQSDIFDEKSSPNSTNSSKSQADLIKSEWKVIPVMETLNDSRPKSSEVLRSVESEQRTKLEADSASPYENGKYLESLEREGNDNERFAIESNDMHESFVEPLDGVDDFDDIRVRLGRSLKTIDDRPETTQSSKISNIKNHLDFVETAALNETHDDVSTKSTTITDNNRTVTKCNDRSNETINANLSNLLGSDNRNQTIRKNQIRRNETRSGVNKIDGIGSMSHSTLPSVGNKNASRVKREGNSYSLTDGKGNPFDMYYGHSNEIINDFYTINPYDYSINQNSRNYFDSDRTRELKYNPNDFEANDYKDRKKHSKRKFRNGKRKKKKKRKKKRKKNTNSRQFKKRAKNLNEINGRFERENRRRRKPRNNFHEVSNRFSKKGKKRKAKKNLKDRERRKIKSHHGGNSNKKIVSGANTLRNKDKSITSAMNIQRMKEFEAGTRRKKLALLLTTDNMEDESQMDLALHGELPGKIVDNIFEQVQRNEALKVALGPGLYRKSKSDDSKEKTYLQNADGDKVRQTEKILEKIMELLDRMVLDEVQKKTCVTLPTDMRRFLEWMLNMNSDEESQEQAPPLPLVHDQQMPDHSGDDTVLFPKGYDEQSDDEVNELRKKVRILQNLINEYNALTAKEKIKVQTVHDYLVRQLNLLLHYIETKEKAGKEKSKISPVHVGAARRKSGPILRYESAIPHAESRATINETQSESKNSTTGFSTLHGKRRPIRSSNKFWTSHDKKRKRRKGDKKRKRHKGKRKHHHGKRYSVNETPEYRKLVHRAAVMRKKRADILEDEWNPFDFRYEEPEVYKSMSILNDENTNKRDERSTRIMQKREILEMNNVTMTNLVTNTIDLLPVKGKNRVEDEMILLNKREAWKKENERQLEEVAFGKDMRNKLGEEEQFKKLTEINKNAIVDQKSRDKRENPIENIEANSKNDCLNNSIYNSTIVHIPKNKRSHDFVNIDTVLSNSSKMKNNTSELTPVDLSDEDKLKMLEQKINVYADNKNDTSN